MLADLNGWKINRGTVPPDMALTEQKPDLVLVDKSAAPKRVLLIELIVTWDSAHNFQAPWRGKQRGMRGYLRT